MKRIWIIDDDAITRFLVTRTLSNLNYKAEIAEFADGTSALDVLIANSNEDEVAMPHIVLLDISMPLMDGWDFLKELENRYVKDIEKVQFIILTSSWDPIDEKKGNANKFVSAFLRKPLNINEFLKVTEAIDQNDK